MENVSPSNNEKSRSFSIPESVKVGDTVVFGAYPQERDGLNDSPIEWQVLDREGNRILVLSKFALDCQPYNTTNDFVNWGTCTLRAWLNGPFLQTAFSEKERELIPAVFIGSERDAEKDPFARPELVTRDRVFLLSDWQVSQTKFGGAYAYPFQRLCPTTDYAITQGVWTQKVTIKTDRKTTEEVAACRWWLRDSGSDPGGIANSAIKNLNVYTIVSLSRRALNVGFDEIAQSDGDLVASGVCGVRPALYIDLLPEFGCKLKE